MNPTTSPWRRRAVLMLLGCSVAAAALPLRAADGNPRVQFETTLGPIVVELFAERAPQTAAHILRLVDKGYYRGLIFHRVIDGFMVQTGGYDVGLNHKQPPDTVVNESANGLSNIVGTLGMARLDHPDSADSQFYINVDDNKHLDGSPGRPGYTVFGRVIEGMDVVYAIEALETTRKAGMDDVPKANVVIEEARRL